MSTSLTQQEQDRRDACETYAENVRDVRELFGMAKFDGALQMKKEKLDQLQTEFEQNFEHFEFPEDWDAQKINDTTQSLREFRKKIHKLAKRADREQSGGSRGSRK